MGVYVILRNKPHTKPACVGRAVSGSSILGHHMEQRRREQILDRVCLNKPSDVYVFSPSNGESDPRVDRDSEMRDGGGLAAGCPLQEDGAVYLGCCRLGALLRFLQSSLSFLRGERDDPGKLETIISQEKRSLKE